MSKGGIIQLFGKEGPGEILKLRITLTNGRAEGNRLCKSFAGQEGDCSEASSEGLIQSGKQPAVKKTPWVCLVSVLYFYEAFFK